ncbi:hypothetical protein J437_LFUL003759 [Ladona fulva]|uniref:Uncharacterized protein n=1 Tax=Ladona fulva TaxID=123851 RepID=A0A8K0JWH9_LADFU|nr:hypothetical protein J437_LFUL003759 [Ladona fulva]
MMEWKTSTLLALILTVMVQASPDVVRGRIEELERIDISKMNRVQCNELLTEKGFQKRSADGNKGEHNDL